MIPFQNIHVAELKLLYIAEFTEFAHFFFCQGDYIWSYVEVFYLVLCRVISMSLLTFFYMQTCSLNSTINWRCCFCPMYISGFFMEKTTTTTTKSGVYRWGFISRSSVLFHSSMCRFNANTFLTIPLKYNLISEMVILSTILLLSGIVLTILLSDVCFSHMKLRVVIFEVCKDFVEILMEIELNIAV